MSTPRIIEIDAPPGGGSGGGGEVGDPLIDAAERAFSSIRRGKGGGLVPVIAVCSSNDARVEIVPLAGGLSSARAGAAASLAVEQTFGVSGDLCSASARLWTDPVDAEGRRQHVLALAMPASTIDALGGVAASHGLSLQGALPRQAVLTREAVSALDRGSSDVTVLVRFDRLVTILAIADGARLAIVRQISIGLETLVDALARTQGPGGGEPVGREQAQRWLGEVGVPRAEGSVPGAADERSSIILAALEPALQRLALEVRQSIRFAIAEGRRDAARLGVVGEPLRGLGGALSARTALELGTSGFARADGDGFEQGASRAAKAGLLLRPRQWREVRERSAWRAGLACGVGVVLGLAALDWSDNARRRERALGALERLEGSSSGATPDAASTSQQVAIAQRARMADRASEWLERSQPVASALAAMARVTPPSITLVSIELSAGASATHTVRGFASRASESDPTDHIRDYVERLRAIPVVSSVTLGAVRREERDDQEVHAFDLTLDLVELPSPVIRVVSGGEP